MLIEALVPVPATLTPVPWLELITMVSSVPPLVLTLMALSRLAVEYSIPTSSETKAIAALGS